MTAGPITSNQKRQLRRFVNEAVDAEVANHGLDKDGLQRLFTNGGKFQRHVATGVRVYSAKDSNYDLARAILGDDFISPQEVALARKGIVYSEEQIAHYAETLPSQDVLEWFRDHNFFLHAGPPAKKPLLIVRKLKPEYFYSPTRGWYEHRRETFSRTDMAEPGWNALHKGPVPGSFGLLWPPQQQLLSEREEVPNAAAPTWGFTTYEAVRGVKLAQGTFMRTSSCDSGGSRVIVGWGRGGGFRVSDWWSGMPSPDLGVASAWKF